MLVTKPLNKSVAFEDIDFSQLQRDYEMENALEVAECHFILNNADKMAIEAYVDYNGNEIMLESQFAVLTENALTDITKSLKDMVKRFIEFMAKFLNNLKNWFKGINIKMIQLRSNLNSIVILKMLKMLSKTLLKTMKK